MIVPNRLCQIMMGGLVCRIRRVVVVDARSVQRKREMCVVFVILSFSRRKVTVPVMAARRDRLADRREGARDDNEDETHIMRDFHVSQSGGEKHTTARHTAPLSRELLN